jgi:hypothetical protein
MSAVLSWRTVTPSNSQQFNVNGTELSVAIVGPQSRFAVYEVRCRDADGFADREYVVRDAESVSDADLAVGKRPPIVGRTRDYDKLLAFIAKEDFDRV